MKMIVSSMYKYSIPRGYTTSVINVGEYIKTSSNSVREKQLRDAFTLEEIELVRKAADSGNIMCKYIMCLIYTGFRPNEFIALTIEKSYNPTEKCFVGGGKTKAGTNRTVTISPKIEKYIEEIIGDRTEGYVFCDKRSRAYPQKNFFNHFAEAIQEAGITRKLTPYCCRHTFASLIMRVDTNADKQKLALMGHASKEMLQHYQHPDYDDLRKVTDDM